MNSTSLKTMKNGSNLLMDRKPNVKAFGQTSVPCTNLFWTLSFVPCCPFNLIPINKLAQSLPCSKILNHNR